ncbi:hypothetical protein KpIITR008_14 [Klebsiella phage KpIITR008]
MNPEVSSKLVCGEAQYLDWYDDDPSPRQSAVVKM